MARQQSEPTPVDYQQRPQGITPRLSDQPHPLWGTGARGSVRLIDPESLKVRKRTPEGEEYLDDPYLALPAPGGKVFISQVKAEDAAPLLSCDPKSGGQPTTRIATDEEVAQYLKVHGPGGHGNMVARAR